MTNPETAQMTLQALVKEHNAMVDLVTENIQLRRELANLQQYTAGLEQLLREAIPPEDSNGGQEAVPVPPEEEVGQGADETQGEVPEVRALAN